MAESEILDTIGTVLRRARHAVPELAWNIEAPQDDAFPELVGSTETTGIDVRSCALRAVPHGRILGEFVQDGYWQVFGEAEQPGGNVLLFQVHVPVTPAAGPAVPRG